MTEAGQLSGFNHRQRVCQGRVSRRTWGPCFSDLQGGLGSDWARWALIVWYLPSADSYPAVGASLQNTDEPSKPYLRPQTGINCGTRCFNKHALVNTGKEEGAVRKSKGRELSQEIAPWKFREIPSECTNGIIIVEKTHRSLLRVLYTNLKN